MRVQPREGRFRPYVDGLVGGRRISLTEDLGSSCIGIPGVGAFCSPKEDVFQSDWTYSVGVGGGVQIPLGGDWAFDAGARFLYGGAAQYVVERSLRTEGELLFFDVARSDTPIIAIQFGFGLLY